METSWQRAYPQLAFWNSRKAAQIAISIFLLFHLFAITCWALPLDTPLFTAFRGFVRPYMRWSGLFQSWDTFAPSPRPLNFHVEGVVITKDGHPHTWKFPRMDQLGFAQRYYKERYRKFAENLQDERNSGIWPDVARFLARPYRDPSNPPEIVMLVRYWSNIVPQADGSYHPQPERAQIFFEYRLQPSDLNNLKDVGVKDAK